MRSTAWTGERIELLKGLWADGKTATAIAACLGVSRSAVLGKIFRLRLCPLEQAPLPTPKDAAPADQRKVSQGRENTGAETGRPVFAREITVGWRRGGQERNNPRQQKRAAADKRGKSLLELTNGTCRWPFGHPGTKKFHFCGAAGADLERGMPYCARHAQRAYLAHHVSPEPDCRAPAPASRPLSLAAAVPAKPMENRPFIRESFQRRWRS